MLGIRRYKKCSLDLWVGEPEDFFCESKWQNFPENFNFLEINSRHLSFVLSPESNYKELLLLVKKKLDESTFHESTKRITFISKSVSEHEKIWAQLDKLFPE